MESSDDFVFAPVAIGSGVADIIFVHGLTGDPLGTWTCPDSGEEDGDYWPKWLHKDVPGTNVYTLGYPTSLFAKWARKEMSLYERAKVTLEHLASYEIGKRPLGLITHSLGGLLAKQIVRTGLDGPDAGWKAIAKNIRLLAFLATPHTGSSLASTLELVLGRFSSDHVELLASGNSQLDELNAAYRSIASDLKIKTLAYYEKYKTRKVAIVVDKTSADPGVDGTVPIPVDADHISIAKPANRRSFVYASIRRHVKEIVEAVSGPVAATPMAQHERDHAKTQALMSTIIQSWLAAQMDPASATGAVDKLSDGVFQELSAARKNALAGRWEGLEKQAKGPAGKPIEYPVYLTIGLEGNVAKGQFRFVWSENNLVLVDETLPIEGGFFDRYLVLKFEDTVSGKLQFGTLLLELGDDGATLEGVDVGVGYTSGRIVMGEVTFRKQRSQT